ncbi:MAG: ribonuclease PH [Dehalococcoidia bacterium]|nr:ribonuclease PH [Dehalococcoidia bacterium]
MQQHSTLRMDRRAPDELRHTRIIPGFQAFADGSALIEMGITKVLCAATVEERVPAFLRSSGKGWVTAEYAMLPRSTISRTARASSDQPGGRASEIQRLIGRTLRAATDLEALGERTVILDCDVLQADGGTRTAAITGAYVALYQALLKLVRQRVLPSVPIRCAVAATSVGMVDGVPLLDLCYEEDVRAQVDFNVAMTDRGEYVELQATAEGAPFSQETSDRLLALARQGIQHLLAVQRDVVKTL